MAPHVDAFVIVEANTTFSGIPKEWFLDDPRVSDLIRSIQIMHVHLNVHRVKHQFTAEYIGTAWDRERDQRNAILTGLTEAGAGDQDIVLLSDVDEIPSNEAIQMAKVALPKVTSIRLQQWLFYYNLETRSATRMWRHPIICLVSYVRAKTPEVARGCFCETSYCAKGGWHLSYFFNTSGIQTKLKSFSHHKDDMVLAVQDDQVIEAAVQAHKGLFPGGEFVHVKIQDNDDLPPMHDMWAALLTANDSFMCESCKCQVNLHVPHYSALKDLRLCSECLAFNLDARQGFRQ